MSRANTGTRRSSLLSLSTLFAALTVCVLGAAPAVAVLPGSVYTQTNAPSNNAIVVFTRAADGTLAETSRVATGGQGDNSTPPFGFQITDSQGAVELSDSEHLLFAVNAGSDTLSSFRVLPGGSLELVGTVPTGDLPVSVDSHGDVVYVLNEGDLGPGGPGDFPANSRAGTIQGYRAAANGQLTPIAGSLEPLSLTGSAAGVAAQIAFDPTGHVLTVTNRFTNPDEQQDKIDTFVLGPDATPGPVRANDTTGAGGPNPGPFGFAYDDSSRAIVSNALDGSISSYQLNSATGQLTFIDNEPTDQAFPCWVVITPDGRYAFVTNTGSESVTRLRINADGTLTELGQTPIPGAGPFPVGPFPTDAVLSADGRFLSVLIATALPGAPSTSEVDNYAVGADGSLTLLDPGGRTPATLPPGVSGLVASRPDATPPDTTITAGPADGSRTNDNTPTFSFATVPANEPNPTFTCSVDGGAAVVCSSPLTLPTLAEGPHTISVAATDFAGNTDPTPATRTFIVDTSPPQTTITAGPASGSTTTDRTPTFRFSSSEAASSFRCRIDGGAFAPCSSPFTTSTLSRGSHTFSVAAIDVAGNIDPTPAVRTFRVGRPQPGCALAGTQRVGTNRNNTLNGTARVDIIFGLGGNDILRGRGNRDCLYGGSGNDRLSGGSGADRMSASSGNDRLTDSSGRDVFDGGSGNDRVSARDASASGRRVADTVRCGTGRDTATVDRRDRVARDCERVIRR